MVEPSVGDLEWGSGPAYLETTSHSGWNLLTVVLNINLTNSQNFQRCKTAGINLVEREFYKYPFLIMSTSLYQQIVQFYSYLCKSRCDKLTDNKFWTVAEACLFWILQIEETMSMQVAMPAEEEGGPPKKLSALDKFRMNAKKALLAWTENAITK